MTSSASSAGNMTSLPRYATYANFCAPAKIPARSANSSRGVKEDTERFNQCFSSPGTDFSPLEPLQAWTDIVGVGIQPSKVRLLCYAPGDIARAECAVALALGARVGVVVDRSLPKDRLFDATPWEGCPNLLMLPGDAMTLRAFLQIDLVPISDAERRRLERAAQMAHEDYVRSATPKEPSLQQWDQLSESLKLSNYHQVAYWEKVLGQGGRI